MSEGSRRMVLERRKNAVFDMSNSTVGGGEMTIEEAVNKNILTENCSYQVGIATATESRLDATRYPVVVKIGLSTSAEEVQATSCGYWRVINASGNPIPFSRRPTLNKTVVKNLRSHCDRLDEYFFELHGRAGDLDASLKDEHTADFETIYNNFSMDAPDDALVIAAQTALASIIDRCTANKWVPLVRVGEGMYMQGIPVGIAPSDQAPMTAPQVALMEGVLTAFSNARAMKARYPAIKDGCVALAAWSTAMMFRTGLQETYEHKEFCTVTVNPSTTAEFVVSAVQGPNGYTPPANLAVGQVLRVSDFKVSAKHLEIGMMMVMGSGLMHYMFNHTTGGTRLSGTLLSILAMHNLVNAATPSDELEQITSLFYEALHPVNKRAVADLFFKKSKVYTHGKSTHSRRYGLFKTDTFAAIRTNPYPAGSHKAFICLSGLKRILQSGLASFLPWAHELAACTAACKSVLQAGAVAHIGANYYTGGMGVTQSAQLDNYLPCIASYMHIFHRHDTLTQSPHLGIDISSRAPAEWTSLLNNLKGENITAAEPEKVKAFLKAAGLSVLSIDLDDHTTWAKANADVKDATRVVEEVLEDM